MSNNKAGSPVGAQAPDQHTPEGSRSKAFRSTKKRAKAASRGLLNDAPCGPICGQIERLWKGGVALQCKAVSTSVRRA